VAAENCFSLRGTCRYFICASCVSAENYLFFAWYLPLTFLYLIRFWWFFTFFIVISKIHFVLYVCVIGCLCLFLGICISHLCALCVDAENIIFLRDTCRYSICASCVAADNFLLFAWYLQLTFFCLICFWWEFTFFIVILTIHFVFYVCVIWCISFFQLLSNIIFVLYALALGIFFFAWFVQVFYMCLMCGCWEFSIVSVVFTANNTVLNTFLVSTKPIYCNFKDTFCVYVCVIWCFYFFLGICNKCICALCVAA
jgi:hypothetical protein